MIGKANVICLVAMIIIFSYHKPFVLQKCVLLLEAFLILDLEKTLKEQLML
jgi:hypothetical protein